MSTKIPKYCSRKNSNGKLYGYVTIEGKRINLGPDGPSSHELYQRVITEYLSGTSSLQKGEYLTVNQLFARFLHHANIHYRKPNGRRTSEYTHFKSVMKIVSPIYGNLPVDEFSPLKLKNCRNVMIEKNWARKNINSCIGRLKHVFKWGCENEIVKPETYHGLQAVAGLQYARSEARETVPVRPVPIDHINAIEPFVSKTIWAAIQICLHSGCRPNEALIMRKCDIETSGEIWIYTPSEHKTEHHGHARHVYLGPQCQQVLMQFWNRPSQAYLFDPREAAKNRSCEGKARRRKNQIPTQRKTRRKIQEKYTTSTFRRAIVRACQKANIPDWTPHQLRHTNATMIRKVFGIEQAKIFLGHSQISVTEIYAEKDISKGIEIARQIG